MSDAAAAPPTERAATHASARDYITLLKPRVMSLVVFTALTGLVCADRPMNPILAGIAILCIAIGAGASGALNMAWDADIDAKMRRTRSRPNTHNPNAHTQPSTHNTQRQHTTPLPPRTQHPPNTYHPPKVLRAALRVRHPRVRPLLQLP